MDSKRPPPKVEAETTYGEICQDFHTEVKKYETEINKKTSSKWKMKIVNGVETHTYSGEDERKKCWTREHHPIYGVTTWTYTSNNDNLEKDKQAGRVGTDGRTIIKFVNHGDYDFIRTEDFIKRGLLACDAVLHESIQNIYIKNAADKIEFNTWLEKVREFFRKKILSECSLGRQQMEGPGNVDYFKPKRELAKKLIADLIVGLAEKLQEYTDDQHSLEKIITDIALAEKLHIIDRGRPAIIKVGTLTQNGPIMVSAQFPQGEQTVPSSYRDRELTRATDLTNTGNKSKKENNKESIDSDSDVTDTIDGSSEKTDSSTHKKTKYNLIPSGPATSMLSNHVVDFTGEIKNNEEIVPLVEVIGHSSYPPISVEDELERRYFTYRAVLENITQIAKNKLKGAKIYHPTSIDGHDDDTESDDEIELKPSKKPIGSKENPLELSLNSMMLLSPFINKVVDKTARKKESEVAQLSESAMALDMVRYGNQPLTLMIDGKPCYVKVDISYMNAPVNMKKSGQDALSEKDLQKRINARGFYDYYDKINKKLIELQKNKKINSHNIKIKYEEFTKKYNEDLKLEKAISALKKEKDAQQESLQALHNKCKLYLDTYVKYADKERKETDKNKKEKAKKKKTEAQTEYKEARHQIVSIEKKLYKKYKAVHQCRKEIFSNNQNLINEIHNEIHNEINTLSETKDKNQNTQEYCNLLQRFLRAQDMYYNKGYKTNLYHFHANYLLSLQQAGESIEAFCKSAEDRTGWLRITLLAYQAFNLEHGRDPNLQNPQDMRTFKKTLVAARQLSASLENNEQNSDARGPQVSPSATGLDDNVIGKTSATLAKEVITAAKEKAAWRQPSFWRYATIGLIGLAIAVGIIACGIAITIATHGLGTGPYILAAGKVITATVGTTISGGLLAAGSTAAIATGTGVIAGAATTCMSLAFGAVGKLTDSISHWWRKKNKKKNKKKNPPQLSSIDPRCSTHDISKFLSKISPTGTQSTETPSTETPSTETPSTEKQKNSKKPSSSTSPESTSSLDDDQSTSSLDDDPSDQAVPVLHNNPNVHPLVMEVHQSLGGTYSNK
ncbi:MAG: hypothetical protein KF702_08060 [Gammaproteobacteria bacterium]|nr:hypothetical protein [Gammaproteobacteria bacterium]